MMNISVKIPVKLNQQLDDAAKKNDIKKSDLIRQILDQKTQEILVGKTTLTQDERDVILGDIWKRCIHQAVDLDKRTEHGSIDQKHQKEAWEKVQNVLLGRIISN